MEMSNTFYHRGVFAFPSVALTSSQPGAVVLDAVPRSGLDIAPVNPPC